MVAWRAFWGQNGPGVGLTITIGSAPFVVVTGEGEAGEVTAAGVEGVGRRVVLVAAGAGEFGSVSASGVEGVGRRVVLVAAGAGEFGSVSASGVEGVGRRVVLVAAGAGEFGSVSASGVEGVGRRLDIPVNTGAGEAGEVTATGVEGTGRALVLRVGAGELGEVTAAGVEGVGRRLDIPVNTGAGESGEVTASGVEGVGSSVVILVLSDFVVPDGHVEVFAALLEIEVSGEELYSTAIGTLLDGDLVLSSDIDFFRLRNRADFAVLNSTGAGSIEDLLEGAGAYVDGRFHFQTGDGLEVTDVTSIDVAEDIRPAGVRFRAQALRTLLEGLVTGERLVVAFTTPADPQTGAGEHGEVAAAGLEGVGRRIEPVNGAGEFGSVAASGVEGTGRRLDIPVNAGVGDFGEVAASGVEGVGRRIEIPAGAGEFGEVTLRPVLMALVGGSCSSSLAMASSVWQRRPVSRAPGVARGVAGRRR